MALIAAGLAACSAGGDKATAPPRPKTVRVLNYLYLPVTLTAGGVSYGTLGAGNGLGPKQVNLTIPGSVSSFSYAVQPMRYTDGSPVPNDLTGETISLPNADSVALGITNEVNGQPFFIAMISNQTGLALTVGVAQGGVVQCVGALSTARGPFEATWLGYYRLTSTTQVHLYNPGTQCTGAYLYWDSSALRYTRDAGVVTLSVEAGPPLPVASLTVTPAAANLDLGQTQQLTATPKDANGVALAGRSVTWSSSSASVASVSNTGLVRAIAIGATTITATSEGRTATATVTVIVPAAVSTITVAPGTASIGVGRTQQLTATLKDANGNTLVGRTVAWSTSGANIASVSANALVTGLAPGTVTITATSEGRSGTATVVVSIDPNGLALGQSLTGLSSAMKFNLYTVNVPTGTTRLVVRVSGGTGDFDGAQLYVRRGETVSTASFDCSSRNYSSFANNEICSIDAPAAGVWSIGVSGTYSGVTLDVNPSSR